MPSYIVLLGPPGVGKGTQAEILSEKTRLPHISSGDLFRENMKNKTLLGKRAQEYTDKGELVPDDLTIAMVEDRLSRPDCQDGVILDGFPRTPAQAVALKKLLAARSAEVSIVPFLNAPADVLVERISGRLTCRAGGHVYHRNFNPPRVAGTCDEDGSDLYEREDDSADTVRRRIRVYMEQTLPLIEFYGREGKLEEIDGTRPIEEVTTGLMKGRDAYPLIHKAITERPEVYNEEQVRNEMYLALGYYVTESSGHNSEYNWWFRKRPDLIEKYCTHSTGWNACEYAYILKEYQHNEATWKDQVTAELARPLTKEDLQRGHEYASYIINALQGGQPFKFKGNVQNTHLITNLPEGACVEVPVLVDRSGFHPMHVGALPPECALLTQLSCGIEEMAIQASLVGDPTMVYRAICHDPLTASVLSLAEIRQMTNELFAQHKDYLPQFKHHQV